VLFLRII